MILRKSYIDAITPFIDTPLVKILSGVRFCGKSTIFDILEDELKKRLGCIFVQKLRSRNSTLRWLALGSLTKKQLLILH